MLFKGKKKKEEVTLENLTERMLQNNITKNEKMSQRAAEINQKEIQIKIEGNKKAEEIVKKAIKNEDPGRSRKSIIRRKK